MSLISVFIFCLPIASECIWGFVCLFVSVFSFLEKLILQLERDERKIINDKCISIWGSCLVCLLRVCLSQRQIIEMTLCFLKRRTTRSISCFILLANKCQILFEGNEIILTPKGTTLNISSLYSGSPQIWFSLLW